jgi:23S rRNA pseudouridine955/2504/2580 synthase
MSEHNTVQLKTVDENGENQRLDNFLIKHLKGVPKSRIYRIVRKGEVRVNKGRKNCDYKLQIDDIVRIPPIRMSVEKELVISDELKQLIKDNILYEDHGLIAINKPAKLAVHSGSGITVGVIDIVRQMHLKPVELVHRLDRATSGVLLIAKKRGILKDLNKQIAGGEMEKRYTALVQHHWAKKIHTIDAPLLNGSRGTNVDNNGKDAVSHFQPLKNFSIGDDGLSLVEVHIETGRTHQIRVHGAYADHKLAGDEKYGDNALNERLKKHNLNRLFLHAHKLSFFNPSLNKMQTIFAPLSKDLQDFLDNN